MLLFVCPSVPSLLFGMTLHSALGHDTSWKIYWATFTIVIIIRMALPLARLFAASQAITKATTTNNKTTQLTFWIFSDIRPTGYLNPLFEGLRSFFAHAIRSGLSWFRLPTFLVFWFFCCQLDVMAGLLVGSRNSYHNSLTNRNISDLAQI